MKFWKFEAPTLEQIELIVTAGRLPPSVSVPGLRNTYDEIARKLNPGDGLVLATLKGDEGRIVAFGRVCSIGATQEDMSIRWAKASHGVLPIGSGLLHWQTKTAFEISAEPAERYGLGRFIAFHIKDAA